MRAHLVLVSIVVLGLSACGGDNTSPTSPTITPPQPVIPNVAGTYRGPMTLAGSLAGVTINASGTMSMVVAQAGAQLTITGSTTILDETHTRGSFVATIDAAGTVTLQANIFTDDDDDDPECPTTATVATLTFSGNMAVFHITETATCGTLELSATLTRQ